jgi:putative SOS response-associated peptidase YedK
MPVLLEGPTLPRWLGDVPLAPAELASLTLPYPAERMQSRPISRYMSNNRNQGPGCLAPPEPATPEPELDFG